MLSHFYKLNRLILRLHLQPNETVSVIVTIEREGETLVAIVDGRIDGTNAGEFQKESEAVITAADRLMILDCEKLTYISSAGLRVVLLTARTLQRQNSKFAICSLTEEIGKVFQISGFDKVIPVFATRADVLEKFGS